MSLILIIYFYHPQGSRRRFEPSPSPSHLPDEPSSSGGTTLYLTLQHDTSLTPRGYRDVRNHPYVEPLDIKKHNFVEYQ